MVSDIGKTGVILLAALFLILAGEDLFIWMRSGAVPGIEFFLGAVVVLLAFVLAIRGARSHPPPR